MIPHFNIIERVKAKQFIHTGYMEDKIDYKINSLGYRTKEFSDIDWANSIVIFGDSTALGEALDEEYTLASVIQSKTGIPTVNLGVGGTSILKAHHDSVLLLENYPAPKVVVYIWTCFYRTVFYKENQTNNYGVWNAKLKNNKKKYRYKKEYDSWFNNEVNPTVWAMFTQMATKHLWKDKTIMYEGSFFKHTSDLFNCNFFPTIDNAKDNLHPGIKSVENAANSVIKSIL